MADEVSVTAAIVAVLLLMGGVFTTEEEHKDCLAFLCVFGKSSK